MKSSIFSEIPFSNVMLAFALLLSVPLSAPAPVLPQCVETNGVKFLLPPNIDLGLDVKDSRDNIVLADDFPCNTTGPITDIHLWGSWLSDIHGTITNFWIGIYNDVPAVTNPLNGQITPSHPGTNLLWQQSFGLGQYAENIYATGQEYFYNPTNTLIVGGDTQAWYYCFYPTNPFVQQGTANNPTNYWLAVSAQILDPVTLFGWKTTFISYNDAAVWGTVLPTSGLPIGNWQSMTNPLTQQKVNLSFKLTTPTNQPPPTGCVETDGVKYLQRPNLQGLDIWNSGPWMLADDFICTNSGPITDIHIWGSWLNDSVDSNSLTFSLGIYDDVPANANNPFSHPGTNLLWQQTFAPGQYAESFFASGTETFLDPGPSVPHGTDSQAWYYCFYPTNPFVQTGSSTAPKTYWLAVYAQLPSGAANYQYGWKTTFIVQNDTSVHAPWPGFTPTNNPGWTPTLQSSTGGPLDLSFKLTTPTKQPPPTVCVETNGVKYVQGPNLNGGFDVWNDPYVLADDFACTNIGPISDMHIWGSWLNDQVFTNSIIFWLGIYNDVPVGPGNTFSHPGTNLLWQQWFTPGQYAETIWTANASEQFLDPGQPQIIGGDSQVWYFCFYPTNPFVQQGSPANPKIYWLAAYAQLPVGGNYNYGWKTTTNVQHDISVHAVWPGSAPTNNPGWTKTLLPTGAPLDLAFKLTTPTNPCGPILITYLATNKVVLSWPSGFLQSSTNVIGPYLDVPGATSPYTNATVIPPYKFYRLRCY